MTHLRLEALQHQPLLVVLHLLQPQLVPGKCRCPGGAAFGLGQGDMEGAVLCKRQGLLKLAGRTGSAQGDVEGANLGCWSAKLT